MALGWPWGGLGVALVSHWVALCSPLSDFSFQLSAFQLLPNRGFGVPCPPSHESRITSGFRWLCPGFLHSAFCLLPSLLGGFGWFSVTSRVKEQIGAGRQIGQGKQIHPVASRQIRAVLHDQVAAQPAIQRWSGEPGGSLSLFACAQSVAQDGMAAGSANAPSGAPVELGPGQPGTQGCCSCWTGCCCCGSLTGSSCRFCS
jgi:hypothetical protein